MPRGIRRPLEEMSLGELLDKKEDVEALIHQLKQNILSAKEKCGEARRKLASYSSVSLTIRVDKITESKEELKTAQKEYDRLKHQLQIKRLYLGSIKARVSYLRERRKNGD